MNGCGFCWEQARLGASNPDIKDLEEKSYVLFFLNA